MRENDADRQCLATVGLDKEQKSNEEQLDLYDYLKDSAKSQLPFSDMSTSGVKQINCSIEQITLENCLILDTETTGLDPENGNCIEVGSILFNITNRSILAQQSFLLPVLVNEAEAINHIPAVVSQLPQPWQEGLGYFKSLVDSSDLIVAHNAIFDKQWFGIGQLPFIDKPWVCTMEDISWPSELQLRNRPSVRDLALAHGVPVWAAHRALTDCIYIAEVFQRCTDLEILLKQGLEPRRLMRAEVSYEQRHLAKQAGFRWNEPIKGAWTRRLSQREMRDLEFSVVPVDFSN